LARHGGALQQRAGDHIAAKCRGLGAKCRDNGERTGIVARRPPTVPQSRHRATNAPTRQQLRSTKGRPRFLPPAIRHRQALRPASSTAASTSLTIGKPPGTQTHRGAKQRRGTLQVAPAPTRGREDRASSGGGRHHDAGRVQSIKRRFGLDPASGSWRDLTSTPQRVLCANNPHSVTLHSSRRRPRPTCEERPQRKTSCNPCLITTPARQAERVEHDLKPRRVLDLHCI
jgi:hypothetical protein